MGTGSARGTILTRVVPLWAEPVPLRFIAEHGCYIFGGR